MSEAGGRWGQTLGGKSCRCGEAFSFGVECKGARKRLKLTQIGKRSHLHFCKASLATSEGEEAAAGWGAGGLIVAGRRVWGAG